MSRESYPAYKPSCVPWLGDVPDHWEVVRLRNVVAGTTERNRPDLPLLSVVRERGVILRDITNTEENHNFVPDDLSNYKVVHSGQFAMNKMKAWQGSYGISQHDGLVSPAYFVFDLHGVTGGYFHAAIRSMAYVPFFAQASDGVRIGQWDLSQARMREIPFPLPPLPEQHAIVRYLNHADRCIRRYVSAKRKLIALLEEEKQAIINRAVTRGLDPNVRPKPSGVEWLGDVPEHWEIRRAKSLGRIRYGLGQPPRESAEGVPLIRATNVERGSIVEKDLIRVDPSDVPIGRDAFLRAQEIIVVRSGAYTADSAVVPIAYEGAVTGYDMVMSITSALPMYMAFALLSSYLRDEQLIVASTRSAQPHLNAEELGAALVLVPSLSEQAAIVKYLDKATAHIDSAIVRARRQIELLQEYRTRLVADVVTGKLDVREAAALLPDDLEDEDPVDEGSPLAEDTYGDSHDPDMAGEELAMESEVTV